MFDKKIKIIDDERDMLKLVQSAWTLYRHEIDIFSEPVEAQEYFRRYRDDCSILHRYENAGHERVRGLQIDDKPR